MKWEKDEYGVWYYDTWGEVRGHWLGYEGRVTGGSRKVLKTLAGAKKWVVAEAKKLNRRTPNPLPIGKWISATAIKLRKVGNQLVADIRKPAKVTNPKPKRRTRNVAMGFYDQYGFHPIRASKDYDPDRLEEQEDYQYKPKKKVAAKKKPRAKKKAVGKKKR